MTSHDHYVVNPPLGGFETGKGLWTPSSDDALWQPTAGGAYWSGIIGELGVQFKVLVASQLGSSGTDYLYDDPTSLYDEATYSTGEISWYDITSAVRDIRIRRGKQNLGARYSMGTATFVFSNESGVWNPQVAPALIGGQTLRPGRLIGVQGKRTDSDEWIDMWIGRIESLGDVYIDAGHDVQSRWNCTGFFGYAESNRRVPLEVFDPATTGQLTSERITYIWETLEGLNPIFLDIAPGTNTMIGSTLGGSLLDLFQEAEEAEGGEFFESRGGRLTFRDKDWLVNNANAGPSYFIGQDGSDLKILNVETSWDAVRIQNWVSLTRDAQPGSAETPTPQVAQNTSSQAKYGKRSVARQGLQNDNDVAVNDLANRVVDFNSFDTLRVDEIDVWASTLESVDTLLKAEIGDVTQVQVKVAEALGWDYTIQAWVFGVEHHISHTDWVTTLRLDNTFRGNPLLAGPYSKAYSSAYKRDES
jgi:hypothetical protein